MQHVNMRASPKNDASVVPEGHEVKVVECTQWCEVVYGDRAGFIYKSFVAGVGQ